MNEEPNSPRPRGLHEIYAEDPGRAEALIWGGKADPLSRRGFFKRAGLATVTAALGCEIVFWDRMPAGLIPAAFAQAPTPFQIPGKEGLVVLNDRPVNAETPAHFLDDEITPAKHLFVRNNGNAPLPETLDPAKWTIEVAGESCERPATFTLAELKEEVPAPHLPPPARMRRQRAQRVQPARPWQPMDGRGGRLPRVDRHPPARSARALRDQGERGLRRLSRSRHPPFRRSGEGGDLTRRPHAQGARG
jgi:hypothetical protein